MESIVSNIPVTFGIIDTETIDGNNYPFLIHLSEFLANKGTGSTSPYVPYKDNGMNNIQVF